MKKKIVSIDERDMNEILKLELSQDYDFVALDLVQKSLDNIKSQKPDLILLEPAWHGADGMAFFKSLKADPATKTIPVITVSSKTFDDEIQDALDLGAEDYIVKPFYAPLLLKRIQNVLRSLKS